MSNTFSTSRMKREIFELLEPVVEETPELIRELGEEKAVKTASSEITKILQKEESAKFLQKFLQKECQRFELQNYFLEIEQTWQVEIKLIPKHCDPFYKEIRNRRHYFCKARQRDLNTVGCYKTALVDYVDNWDREGKLNPYRLLLYAVHQDYIEKFNEFFNSIRVEREERRIEEIKEFDDFKGAIGSKFKIVSLESDNYEKIPLSEEYEEGIPICEIIQRHRKNLKEKAIIIEDEKRDVGWRTAMVDYFENLKTQYQPLYRVFIYAVHKDYQDEICRKFDESFGWERRKIEIEPDEISKDQEFDLTIRLVPTENIPPIIFGQNGSGEITISLLTNDFDIPGGYRKTIEIFRHIPSDPVIFKGLKLKRETAEPYIKLSFYFNRTLFDKIDLKLRVKK